ncbi:MAG: phytanoyl-CoA dioxygenase family protein [Gammaproteobacteria bacterium]|nr:phytanoyl-CoA dioxygenase family protein [Gammaproteobacteria bacterium]
MNDQEKFLFDLRGYIVVENALTSTQVSELSDRLEERRRISTAGKDKKHSIFGSDRTVFANEDDAAWTSPSLLEWGGTYIDLIDLPTIAPYLETLLGVGYRLDHDYLKIENADSQHTLYLHGGGQGAGGARDIVGPTDGGQCFYRYNNGKFYNGLVTIAFELSDVSSESGGFACVPGSHKMNFALPEEWRISKTQAGVHECVDRVSANAGDAIIFTEACAHGTVPWEGGGERRTIFYKYCPHAVAWGACFYNADNYGDLTENQRAILMPPSAYGPHPHTAAIWKRAQEEQTELNRLRKEVGELRAQQEDSFGNSADS